MNLLDVIIIIVFGYCLIRGIFRGLIKEVSSIIGAMAGFYGAYSYYAQVAKLIAPWVKNASQLNLISVIVTFVGIFVIVNLLGLLIKLLFKISFLNWVDRLAGALFGTLKGFILISILLFFLTTFLKSGTPILADSRLAPYLSALSDKMVIIVPKEMHDSVDPKLKRLKEIWQKKQKLLTLKTF